jgi:hypothetical protein
VCELLRCAAPARLCARPPTRYRRRKPSAFLTRGLLQVALPHHLSLCVCARVRQRVCVCCRANLYEFQKYNRESNDELYFTVPRLQQIAKQVKCICSTRATPTCRVHRGLLAPLSMLL